MVSQNIIYLLYLLITMKFKQKKKKNEIKVSKYSIEKLGN